MLSKSLNILLILFCSISLFGQVTGTEKLKARGTSGIAGITTDSVEQYTQRVLGNFLSIGTTSDSIVTTYQGRLSKVKTSTLISNNAWSLTGNSGTTAGTNFLGTTDPVSLILKTNNITNQTLTYNDTATTFQNIKLNVSAGVTVNKQLYSTTLTGLSSALRWGEHVIGKRLLKIIASISITPANYNKYWDIGTMSMGSLEGTVDISLLFSGNGFGQGATYRINTSYNNDYISRYSLINTTGLMNGWFVVRPISISPRHILGNEANWDLLMKINANSDSFRLRLNGNDGSTSSANVYVYINHSNNFENASWTELNTIGTDTTAYPEMPNILSGTQGTSIINNSLRVATMGVGTYIKNTTALGSTLDIYGNLRALNGSTYAGSSYGIDIGSGGASVNYYKGDYNYFQKANGTDVLTTNSIGAVGINNNNPQYQLHVKANSSNYQNNGITIDTGGVSGAFKISMLGNLYTPTFLGQNGFYWGTNQLNVGDYHSSVIKMALTLAGNLGIGILSPSYKLDVNGLSSGNPLRLQGLSDGANTDSLVVSTVGVLKRATVSQMVSGVPVLGAISINNSGNGNTAIGSSSNTTTINGTLNISSSGSNTINIANPTSSTNIDGTNLKILNLPLQSLTADSVLSVLNGVVYKKLNKKTFVQLSAVGTSIPTNVSTVQHWNIIKDSTSNMTGDSLFTAPESGIYTVSGAWAFIGTTTSVGKLGVFVGGTNADATANRILGVSNFYSGVTTDLIGVTFFGEVFMNKSETLKIKVFQNTGATQTTATGLSQTVCTIKQN